MPQPIADPLVVEFARGVLAARRLRDDCLPDLEFFDPCWDMLVDLFVATETRQRVSVSSLSIAAAVPKSTALRTIARLVHEGLLLRDPDPHDGRRNFVFLSPELHSRLNHLLGCMRSLCVGMRPSASSPHPGGKKCSASDVRNMIGPGTDPR